MHPINVRDHTPPPVDATLLGRAVQTILDAAIAVDSDVQIFRVADYPVVGLHWEARIDDHTHPEHGESADGPAAALLDLAEKLRCKPA